MSESLAGLALAVLVFVGSHVLVSSTPLRGVLVGVLGETGYTIAYSAMSAVFLVWVGWAYRAAPYEELWAPVAWARWVPILVMPVASVFLVAGLTTPNPTAVGGDRLAGRGEPATGILKVTRHPVMWAFALWAMAHIPINGDAASLFLFGSMLVLALAGQPLIDRKKKARLGADWERLAAVSSNLPFAALLSGRTRVSLAEIGWHRIGIGLVLYLGFLDFHARVIGVSPLP